MAIIFSVAQGPPPLTFDDDFTGNNGDPPNASRWENIYDTGATYQIWDNRLRYDCSGGNDIGLQNFYEFPGDFDVQVDWWKITGGSANNWHGWMTAYEPSTGYWSGVGRLYSISHRIRYGRNYGSHIYTEIGTSANNGKFRFTRIGTDLRGYHDVGSGWSSIDYFPDRSQTIQIRLYLTSGETNPPARFEWDNLIDNLA